MKIEVRYQSRGGNTRVTAEYIAKIAQVTAQDINSEISEDCDLLFIGGGVYAWDIDKSLKNFLENLNSEKIKFAAVYCTTGTMNKCERIAEFLRAKNIKVCDDMLLLRFGLKNHTVLGGKDSDAKLSEKDYEKINKFVKNIIEFVNK